MKATGSITRLKEKGHMFTKMEISMMENGRMICNMVKERNLLSREISIRVSLNLGKSMVLESIPGLMDQSMMGNGLKTNLTGMECIQSQMEEYFMALGIWV